MGTFPKSKCPCNMSYVAGAFALFYFSLSTHPDSAEFDIDHFIHKSLRSITQSSAYIRNAQVIFVEYFVNAHTSSKFAEYKGYWYPCTLNDRFTAKNFRIRDNTWIKFN